MILLSLLYGSISLLSFFYVLCGETIYYNNFEDIIWDFSLMQDTRDTQYLIRPLRVLHLGTSRPLEISQRNGLMEISFCVSLRGGWPAPSIVYSFGSNGEYSFERDLMNASQSEIFTFDCTVPDDKRQTLGPRHHSYPLCIGSPRHAKHFDNIASYQQIVERLGHERIDVLKIDIENFEWDVLGFLSEADGSMLPAQISVEFHYKHLGLSFGWMRARLNAMGNPKPIQSQLGRLPITALRQSLGLAEVSLMFSHLANLGYAVVHKEPNPTGCSECFEFTLLRVEQDANSLVN